MRIQARAERGRPKRRKKKGKGWARAEMADQNRQKAEKRGKFKKREKRGGKAGISPLENAVKLMIGVFRLLLHAKLFVAV